jgi:hypothetical protein
VTKSYRKVLWILVFALLLAITEYGLAFQQSGRPHRSLVEDEFWAGPDHAKRQSPTNGRDTDKSAGPME